MIYYQSLDRIFIDALKFNKSMNSFLESGINILSLYPQNLFLLEEWDTEQAKGMAEQTLNTDWNKAGQEYTKRLLGEDRYLYYKNTVEDYIKQEKWYDIYKLFIKRREECRDVYDRIFHKSLDKAFDNLKSKYPKISKISDEILQQVLRELDHTPPYTNEQDELKKITDILDKVLKEESDKIKPKEKPAQSNDDSTQKYNYIDKIGTKNSIIKSFLNQNDTKNMIAKYPTKYPSDIETAIKSIITPYIDRALENVSTNIRNSPATKDEIGQMIDQEIDKLIDESSLDRALENKIKSLPDKISSSFKNIKKLDNNTNNNTNNETDKIKDMYDKLQYKGMAWPREKLAKILKWAHQKAYEYNKKIHDKGDKAAWYQKAFQFLTRIIEFCTRKLHNFVSDDKNQITWEYDKKPTNESFRWNTNRIVFCEDKLTSKERTNFGLPRERKYPMPDKAHVLAAIRMFNHVDPYNEKELAGNIKKKMRQYGISPDQVGEKNRLKKYL